MSKQDVSTDIKALRRDARLEFPLVYSSRRVFNLYCEWRCGKDLGQTLRPEEQAAFLMLIAEVLENPQ